MYDGDSCEYVAQGFRITVAALIQLNPGLNCDKLPVGSKICVPSADSYPNSPPCENYHLVSPGRLRETRRLRQKALTSHSI